MSALRHTPGPWHVEGPYDVAGGGRALGVFSQPLTVATVGCNEDDDQEACRADAALIAAAPDLLAALMSSRWEIGFLSSLANHPPTAARIALIDAAIAKAGAK